MPTRKRSLQPQEKAALDRAKKYLARVLRDRLERQAHCRQKRSAYQLETSVSLVSAIETGGIDRLSFNQIFRFLVRLEPEFEISVSLIPRP